ncbi:hypothetical protein N9A94_08745 [Akkermansiaceae bacterium]|nr:hypothetical protein [Akkermansiaceae bacterium]MDA7888123.1 hypothetical protein [Akkermansiaceae bacterium]MDB4537049.1 hypothetical protein [Akkermansiaceae bacterium]MDB4544559.1 hypothetical protein [Akkermansiaceae bacterium]
MMKHLLLILLSVSFVANAQEQEPTKYFRFIPLGERPTWNEKIEGEFRVEQEHPPGSMPPKEVSVATSGTEFETFFLRLTEFTDITKVKTSAKALKLTEGPTPGGAEFVGSKFPAKPYSLGVLYRDNADMTWLKPKLMLLPNDLASFPNGQVRFVNTSAFEIAVQFGKERPFAVKPGKVISKPLKVGETQATVAVKLGGAYKPMMTNNIVMRANERIQVFFFKSQGKKPTAPVQMVIKPEVYQDPRRG